MSTILRRINRHKKGKHTIAELNDSPSHVLIIHYSCESFYDIKDGKTPRITSIAVRYLKSAQTKSFSIHKVAERNRVSIGDITNHYDQLESEMLREFFEFVYEHKDYRWIHWNMRDINYGFEAIENRFRVLGGAPTTIIDEKKFDIARILIDKYGVAYVGHPRLLKLMEINHITPKDLLTGDEEAKAFENKEFVKLHQSTLRKVDIIHDIINRAAEEKLKTKAKLFDIYGISPQGIFELAKDNWILSLIFAVIGLFIGIWIQSLSS